MDYESQIIMKAEKLFEIQRQISVIKKNLQLRQQKVTQWTVPLQKILHRQISPDQYLSKKYSDASLKYYQSQKDYNKEEAEKQLQNHVKESRIKIRQHKNDLKQLDNLLKKKNRLRLVKIDQQSLSTQLETKKQSASVQLTKNNSLKANKQNRRPDRENNLFTYGKGDKIFETFQEGKAKSSNAQQLGLFLKKHLGVGIQNTPFAAWFQQKSKQQGGQSNQSSRKNSSSEKAYRLTQSMKKTFHQKKYIYLENKNQQAQKFENRLKNIIRYHEKNVNSVIKSYHASSIQSKTSSGFNRQYFHKLHPASVSATISFLHKK